MTENNASEQDTLVEAEKSKVIKRKPLTPAQQDQVIANFTEASKLKLRVTKENPELIALMGARGFGLEKLIEGEALQQALQISYAERQVAMGKASAAQEALNAAREDAQAELSDFRETARAFFRTTAEQEVLGIRGVLPKDMDKLLLSARTSYASATLEPYNETFEMYGYDELGLVTAHATLTTLESARAARAAALAAAVTATATRNADYQALVRWMQAFDRIARVALRKHPALLARL